MNIRILSIYWGFSLGGGVKYAEILDRIGEDKKYEIAHVCIRDRRWDAIEDILHKIKCDSIFITSRLDFDWIKKLSNTITRYDPDMIMTHGFNGHFALCLALFLCKKKDYIKICSYHGRYHPPTPNIKLLSYLRKIATRIIAVSYFSKTELIDQNISSHKIDVIHNGINTLLNNVQFLDIRDEWNVSKNDFLLGTVCRIDSIKGINILIESIYILKNYCTNLKLVVVGNGPQEKHLKDLTTQKGLEDRIIFAGKRLDIPNCLYSIDCFVLPSLEENHSIALLEAMRSRKAIIATDVGGNGESVRDGIEGLLVPSKDSMRLALAIQKMYYDKKSRDEYSHKAYSRFKNEFTSSCMIENTSQWIEQTFLWSNKI
jgi:glycosyltransferase involved in cell wall biosynthesis